jgi:hypothetical protein
MENGARKHKCPHCKTDREAPLSVLAHPRDTYTVTCDCGKKYAYCYFSQKVRKVYK